MIFNPPDEAKEAKCFLSMNTDERLDQMEVRLTSIERTIQQIRNISIGIAIGLVIAGIIFGVITIKEAVDVVK